MYTSDALQGKDLTELRAIARPLGINPAGKNVASLIMAIVKESKAQNGQGTAASPNPAPKRRPAPPPPPPEPEEDEEEVDDIVEEDEEEDDDYTEVQEARIVTPEIKPVATASTEEQEARSLLRAVARAITVLLGDEISTVAQPEAPKPPPPPPPPVVKEAPKEEKPAAKRGRPRKDASAPAPTPPTPPPPPPPPPEPEEDEEVAEEDDAEMDDELDITEADVAKADFPTLIAWAKIMNANDLGPIKIDGAKEKDVRAAILQIVKEASEEESEESGDAIDWPEWVEEGARVETNMGDEGWLKAVIREVTDTGIRVELFDGDLAEVDNVEDIRPAPSKTPRERKRS